MSSIEVLNRYWTLLSGVAGLFVTIGYLIARVNTSISSAKKLFAKTDSLEMFKAAQDNENKNFQRQIDGVAASIGSMTRDTGDKLSRVEERVDRVLELMQKQGG